RSLNIAASYHEKRFKITKNNKHIGLTKSLNKGIAITNTEFIARHDSDDFSSKDRLEKEVDFLNKNKHVAVVGSFAKVYN
ncbi:glycosyltransferase, partial [Streptococcus pneumoniae]|uniref:glycosyltransferase n=1 Tax=Streptococcus pneumoniae TaxID=1313 RepID=UPI0012D850DD